MMNRSYTSLGVFLAVLAIYVFFLNPTLTTIFGPLTSFLGALSQLVTFVLIGALTFYVYKFFGKATHT